MTCWATHWHRDGGSRHRKLRVLALAGTSALVLMLAAGEARADPVDWVGDALKEDPVTGAEVPDEDWTNPDNWTPKKVPTGDDDVQISDASSSGGVNPVLDGASANVGSLALIGGGTLTVRNGATLTVDGGNGIIDLRSDLVIGNSIFGTGGIAPGDVNAALVDFAPTGTLTFDHNDTSGLYAFAPDITGAGRVSVLSGWTVLTGFNDYTGGTEIKALATLRGDSESLFGVIEGEAHNFGGTIFASTLIIGSGGNEPLEIVAGGGIINLQAGDHVLADGTDIGGDRLIVNNANVTVGAGATFGTSGGGFPAGATIQDGLELGTYLIDSTVTFEPGSTVSFLSDIHISDDSTLVLNNGPASDNAVVSRLSGGFGSTLEIGEETTLHVFSSIANGGAGTFAGALTGHGDIFKSGEGTWTLLAGDESTFDGNIEVLRTPLTSATAPDLIAILSLPQASLSILEDTTAFVSRTIGSLTVSGRLGVHEDETPGRLDVTGNMVMDPLTVLTMNLGAPGSAPGVGSDLITVGGNLSLDGVLLVEDAGGFGFGLYRLFTYGGALTDGSLEVVGIPAGFSVFDFNVSTATAGQVNLLVGDVGGGEPPEIAFFPDDIDTWQPDDFDPATTVIFQGEGREITLSGEVSLGTGGIQFADDGFALPPGGVGGYIVFLEDPFGLGARTPIRVGDGTAAGAEFTGTIGVDLTGLGGLVKTDLGTLVLTGNNDYTGGTRIEAGTVQGTTESLQGDIGVLSGGTVAFTGVNGTFTGTLSGDGEATMDYTERMTLATGMVASGFSMGIQVGDLLVVPGDTLGTVRFEKVTIDNPASLTVGQGATVEVVTLEGAPGSVVAFEPGSVLVVEGDSILDEIAGEDSTLKVVAALTMAGNSPDYTGTIEVLEGATLSFSSEQDGGFGGRVTGAGNVVKDGDGTLELFFGFVPAFSGGVFVAAGDLRGDSGSLNGDFDILSGGTLTFRQALDGVFGGTISGAGNVVKDGDGTLELFFGFDPAFSGGVSVAAGALSGHAGNLPGNIEVLDAGTLQFFQVMDGTYSGTVTGGGTLVKAGEGELTLETSSAWSRVLILDVGDGDVRVASEEPGGAAGFGGASIAGGSVLTVGSDTTVELDALNGAPGSKISLEVRSALVVDGDSILDEIEGDGLLDIRGDATLAGDSPGFAGDIDVGEGANVRIVAVYGSTADLEEDPQRMGLGQGAGLAGFGYWLGEVVLESGSTIAPGNSIGTLTVGEIAFNAGSTFEVELSDGGNLAGVHNDLLAVTGAATIDGGTVHVTPENGTDTGSTYTPGTIYTILTAGGGVSGTFDALTDDYAFLNFALSYDASSVFLTSSLADLCLAGFTANQCAVADAIETLGTGALFTAVTNLSGAEAPVAMNQLSGEVHASATTALIEDSRFAREAALARLRVALGSVGASRNGIAERQASEHFAFWGQAFGAWGEWTGNGNAADMDRSIGGFFMGGDAAITDTARLGAFGGYQTSDFDVDDRSASGKADTFTLGAYGGGQWGPLGLRLGAAYGWSEVETKRKVVFTGFSDSLSASRDTRLAQVHAEAGYRIDVASASFEPFANLAYVHFDTDGFTETGGEAALMAADQNMDTTFATVGVRGEARVAVGATEAALHGMAGWRHAFDDAMPVSMQTFAMSGEAFSVAGVLIAEEAFVLDAGLDVKLTPSATLGLGYSGQFGSGVTDQGAKAHFAVRF